MRSPGSQIKTRAPADMKAVKVDDYTVDFVLTSPNPILQCGVGHLVHVLQEVGGGERGDAGAGRLRDLAQSVRAQGQRHRSLHDRQPRARREDRVQAEPQLVGQEGAQPRRGDLPDHQVGRHARGGAAVGRHRHDGPGAGPGHRARQEQPQCDGADRSRDQDHLPQHGFHARRAALLQRQGQEPLQGRARAQGLLPGDRHRGDPQQGDARHVGQLGAADLAAALRARRRVQAPAL